MISLCVAWAGAQACVAAEPAQKPLEYRFIFVPEERPQDWPKRKITYLPVAREEFEELVKAANAQPRLAEAGAARITRASYLATYQEPDLLIGEAQLELPHGGEKTALVTLDPFGLSLTAAQWADGGEATVGVQPAGKLAALVQRPGTLVCQWSLRGHRDATGALVFTLDLPAATVGQLELQLPDALTPVLNDGVELGRADDHRSGRWRFQLAGRPRLELRLEASESRGRPRGLALLQEKTTYTLLPGGIDLSAHLKLDVQREPLRRLELDLDSQLRVASVQYAGAEVPWSVRHDAAAKERRLSIHFAEPLLGPGRVVTVTALAPLQIDAAVKLPRLRVRDVAWQEGEVSLVAPAPLALDALLPQGCRQTKISQLTGGPSGESIELQLFSPDASVEVQLSRRPSRGKLTSGTTLRLAPDSMRAEFRGHIEATEGEWFTLQATVAAGWDIDAVTADRTGVLANWTVNRSARPAVLVLQLAESVAANRPLELMITGHRRATAETHFAGQTLEMLHFRNLTDERRLLVLETAASQNVRLHGIDRPRMRRRSSLSAADRALLPSAFSDAILEVDTDRKNWSAVVERRIPRFSADIHGLVQVGKREFTESYLVRCQPDDSRVDRLVVSFSQSRAEAPEFSGDGSLGAVTAERLTADDQAARGVPPQAEAWLLRWAQPAAGPFELRTSRTMPLEDRLAPALAAAPDAADQQGVVETQFTAAPLVIETAGRLEPIAPQAPADGESPAGSAAFRYDPNVELSGITPPALILRAPADTLQPALAHVCRLRLHSLYRASGESDHLAVLDLENRGASQCVLSLPPGAELISARVNDTAVARRPDGQELKLHLPDGQAFPTVIIEYLLRDRRMGAVARCEAPWPTIDLPVALREWKVLCASQYGPLNWSDGPPDWPVRLFGPLARSVDDLPFNPLSPPDWRRAASRWRREAGSLGPATRLLESLGQTIASANAPVIPLGRLFTASQSVESGPVSRVVVDGGALAAISIDAAAPISSYDAAGVLGSEAAAALAAQRLGSLGLALILDGEQIVLTSRSAAMERGSSDLGGFVFIGRASAADAARRNTTTLSHYVPLAAWLQSPETAWRVEVAESGGHLNRVWMVHDIGPDGTGVWCVYLVRRDLMVAAGWALGALVFWLGAWLFHGRFVWLVLTLGFAVLGATWAPAALMPLAWAVLFGSLASAAWHRVRPRARRSSAKTQPAVETGRAGGWAAASSLVLLAIVAAAADGDDTTVVSESAVPAAVHRVFVPVDSANQPGTLYQVPTDFLDELRRRASRAANEPRGWLITSAKYECQLAREALEKPISVTAFTARFTLEVLSPYVRLRLPFFKRQVELELDGARLDGQPIKMVWSESGDELLYDLTEPGLYELELSLLPVLSDAGDVREINLSIPKVALATLDVSLPAEGLAVEIPGIAGEQRVLEGGRKLSASLGPIDTLTLRWPQPTAVAPVAEVEYELLWLTVRPGSVVLDVTLKLNVTGGALRVLEFAADRRLRLVPGAVTVNEQPAGNRPAPLDAPQTIELELERPLTGQDTVRLSFLLTGASGVGSLRLPSFHTLNARVARRWLAVTVDAGLEYATPDGQRLETLPAADFAAQWDGAEAALPNALAYRLTVDETAWSLATWSREPQTTVKESLSLSFQRTHAQVRYDAQLMTSAGYVFQHRLLVPLEIEIEDIVLEEDGANRVSHWARSEQGVVSVFLNRRLTGAQQLTLTGRLPVRASGRVALPTIGVEVGGKSFTIGQAEILSRLVRLYRQPAVRIALEEAAGLSPLPEPPAEPFDSRLGRLVIAQAAGDHYRGNVVVTANEFQVHDLQQLTSLRYTNQQWQAEINFRFRVEDGVLDLVRLGVPPDWSNVEVVSPAALSESSQQPGDNRQELVVRPLVAFSGECQLKLRAAVKFPPGGNVTAPDIVATDLPAGDRFWLLPRQVGIEAVSWDVERMSPATLAERWADLPAEASLVYRALGERPQAVMSAVKASTDLARVRLSDVRLAISGGRLSGAAAFDLSPGGRASCHLELAAGWQLIEVSVGGMALAPIGRGQGKWEVPLRSNRLPQRVEAAFVSDEVPPGTNLRWPIAWLENWPVEETVLTFYMPDDYNVKVGIPRATQEANQAVRLASAVELTELPAESVATTERDELAAWYGPWAHWLVFCARESRRARADFDTTPGGSSAIVDDNWTKNARRLGVEQILRPLTQQPLRTAQTLEIWQQLHAAERADHYHWTGSAGPTEIGLVRPWRGLLQRLTGSFWVGAFVVAGLAIRRLAIGDLLDRWPHVLLVVVGLLWWLFCQPSPAGWLLIGCGLALTLRSLWRPLPP